MIENNKLIIFIPTYNSELSLEYTLKHSCIDDTRCKLIVVDNSSCDATLLVAKKYGIEIISNCENIGRINNWNRCLDIVEKRGYELFKFLFSGDTIEKEELNRSLKSIEDKNISMVCGSYNVINNESRHIESHFKKDKELNYYKSVVNSLQLGNFFGPPSCHLYRAESIKGIRFDTTRPWLADWKFSMQVSKRGVVRYVIKPLATFNVQYRNFFRSENRKIETRLEESSFLADIHSESDLTKKYLYAALSKNFTIYEILMLLKYKVKLKLFRLT